MTEKIIIFTDGSSTIFKDKNGMKHGGVGIYCPKYPKCNKKISYKASTITNQKMELTACVKAIKGIYEYMTDNFECKLWELVIYTDSMYVINTITEYCSKWILYGWNRCVNKKRYEICNLELIKELYVLSRTLPITFIHVKAHTKQPEKNTEEWELWYGNKMADEFSRKAMESSRDIKVIGDDNSDNDNKTSESDSE